MLKMQHSSRHSPGSRFVRWFAALGLATGICQTTHGAAGQIDLPPNVRLRLEAQVSAFSTFHAEYTETLKGDRVPEWYVSPLQYSLALNGKKFYLRTHGSYRDPSGSRFSATHEDAFDGRYFYYGDPDQDAKDQKAAMLRIHAPDMETDPQRATLVFSRYPEAAGFYLPQTIGEFASMQGIQSLVLVYEKQSEATTIDIREGLLRVSLRIPDPLIVRAQEIDLARRRKDLMRTKNGKEWAEQELRKLRETRALPPVRTVTFLLDPARGYAVVERTDRSSNGNMFVQVQCEDWQHFEAADIWLPGRCVEVYYADRLSMTEFSDKPVLTATYKVTRVQFQPPRDTSYALDYSDKPGSYLFDRTSSEAQKMPDHELVYRVSADGAKLRQQTHKVRPQMRVKQALLLFLVINVVAVGGYIAFKRKRQMTHEPRQP